MFSNQTIFISSSFSVAPREVKISRIQTSQSVSSGTSTALLFCKYFKGTNDPGNKLLHEWVEYFNGEAGFIEAIHERARGCASETISILKYFSEHSTAGNEQSPFKKFFEESLNDMTDGHYITMDKRFSKRNGSLKRKLAYSLLMNFLDYNIGHSRLEADVAGKWLWKQLQIVTGKTGSGCVRFIETIIDGGLMSIECMGIPRAVSLRANIVLRSLPASLYMNQKVMDDLQSRYSKRPFRHLSVRGFEREEKMVEIFMTATSLRIGPFIQTRNSAMDSLKIKFENEDIRLFERNVFSTTSIKQDLHHLIYNRHLDSSQWIFLRPVNDHFAWIDFALLLLPKGHDPPVLMPIKVTQTIMTHLESDKLFRNGVINSRSELVFNPLMKAFYEETQGRGRIQFIWVGSRLDDAERAAHSTKFDKSSFFCLMRDWRAEYSGDFPPLITPAILKSSYSNIGYRCGEAIE